MAVPTSARTCVEGRAHRWRCGPPSPSGIEAVCVHCGAERVFDASGGELGRYEGTQGGWRDYRLTAGSRPWDVEE